jgi:hypothetical protein
MADVHLVRWVGRGPENGKRGCVSRWACGCSIRRSGGSEEATEKEKIGGEQGGGCLRLKISMGERAGRDASLGCLRQLVRRPLSGGSSLPLFSCSTANLGPWSVVNACALDPRVMDCCRGLLADRGRSCQASWSCPNLRGEQGVGAPLALVPACGSGTLPCSF